ncbi:MAG: hypothetical protein PHW76_08205 [Alphaproteobacteria bacterium]|nr:hypothetical protein [Alphaproteobacteria bacterium]
MATVYDIQNGFNPQTPSNDNLSENIYVHFRLNTSTLYPLTQKRADQFLMDALRRASCLKGRIWCLTSGATQIKFPEACANWEMICQFDSNADLAALKANPTIDWLDAYIKWTFLCEGSVAADPQRIIGLNYFHLHVEKGAVPNSTYSENASILV